MAISDSTSGLTRAAHTIVPAPEAQLSAPSASAQRNDSDGAWYDKLDKLVVPAQIALVGAAFAAYSIIYTAVSVAPKILRHPKEEGLLALPTIVGLGAGAVVGLPLTGVLTGMALTGAALIFAGGAMERL